MQAEITERETKIHKGICQEEVYKMKYPLIECVYVELQFISPGYFYAQMFLCFSLLVV